jgi:hypothetical protein
MADTDSGAFVPEHVKDNYRALVAERHGDWLRLAREIEATGDSTLARWAASQAGTSDAPVEKAVDRAPRTTRAKKTA